MASLAIILSASDVLFSLADRWDMKQRTWPLLSLIHSTNRLSWYRGTSLWLQGVHCKVHSVPLAIFFVLNYWHLAHIPYCPASTSRCLFYTSFLVPSGLCLCTSDILYLWSECSNLVDQLRSDPKLCNHRLSFCHFCSATCAKLPIDFILRASATTLAFLGWYKIWQS